jgi:hypothetical protein
VASARERDAESDIIRICVSSYAHFLITFHWDSALGWSDRTLRGLPISESA